MLKRISTLLLVGILLILTSAMVHAAKNVVVPTAYGYGVVRPDGGFVYPYISGWAYPYSAPGYLSPYLPFPTGYYPFYLDGYYPYYGSLAGDFGTLVPHWNGIQWVYTTAAPHGMAMSLTRLNIRSTPGMGGSKPRSGNVIGGLSQGEPVYILGRAGNWVLIQTAAAPVRRGYVYYSYLQTVAHGPAAYYPWYTAYVRR